MSTFSERLSECINESGMTQKNIAKKANVTEASLSRYANAEHNPAIVEFLPDIAKTLGTSCDYLLGATNKKKPYESLSPEIELLLKAYSCMTAADKAVLWALCDRYISPFEKEKLIASSNVSVG